jgi:hypothetical protein
VPKPGGPLMVTQKVDGQIVNKGTDPIRERLLYCERLPRYWSALGSPISLDFCDKTPFSQRHDLERPRVVYDGGLAKSDGTIIYHDMATYPVDVNCL